MHHVLRLLTRSTAAAVLVVLAGCTSSQFDQATSEQAEIDLGGQLAALALSVDEATVECAVGQYDPAMAQALATDDLGSDEAHAVAEAVVDCDRSMDGLGQLLGPVANAAPKSLDCAIAELDHSVVVQLLASALRGSDGARSADEIQVTTALSLCLSPEELVDFHR